MNQNGQSLERTVDVEKSEEYYKETHCPSCGRFIGIYERCPYCQALTKKRLSVRVFKIFSIFSSTVGLILLLFYAQRIKTPETTIAALGPLSNFAHVRLKGIVEKSYGIHPQWNSLAFILQQRRASGEKDTIKVTAYAKVASDIKAMQKVPNDGDHVEVEGTVRFQKDTPTLLINAPEHLVIIKRCDIRATATFIEAEAIDKTMIDKIVVTRGEINDVVNFPRGTLVRIKAKDKDFPIWIPLQIAAEAEFNGKPGEFYEFIGKVKPFRDYLELEVFAKEGIISVKKDSQ